MAGTYHHGALREALVVAALSAIEKDAVAPSLREVARIAGVSAMAPYRHFQDRAAMLVAVADYGFARLHAALAAADATDDSRAALLGQGRAYVAFARANPALFRLMFQGEVPGAAGVGHPQTSNSEEANGFTVLARRVATLVPDPAQADSAALACWSLVHGLATLLLDRRIDPPADAVIDTTLGYIVAGVASGSTIS
ncbi:MAG: WHG domain-containing protein [Sphingomonas sp.]|uniref:TetR/AcrR family transcriptional regulator n=1 Tax=Sphingomonas sp. TaxID=28214 RepID=UPI001ACF72D3|nr:TetR/AcrR family transcriptional regulator [Sphingomonas sp.]MBN8808776.1 WHG domain-containing protein [Sphingomonas sp.]